jgi:uncharacterized protein YfdQ (DUF2303 family)
MAEEIFGSGGVGALRDIILANSIVEVLSNNSSSESIQVPLPPGFRLEDTERFEVNPNRFRGCYCTGYIDDFISYVTKRGTCYSAVFLSPEQMQAKVILDMGTTDDPLWGDDTAVLTLKPTPEFAALLKFKEIELPQRDLVDFLEDWSPYVSIGVPEDKQATSFPAAIMAIRNVTVQSMSESTTSVADFNQNLSSTDRIEINSKGAMLPKQFVFKAVPYRGLKIKTFWCTLRAIPKGNEVVFKYRIQSLDVAVSEMADEFRERLLAGLDTNVFCGAMSYQGK